ncbi:MAG: hypothetical protein GXO86_08990 [Chlorobi bacterium]|nr:hypothetical protein [Chlorobiota bacterium]
MHYKYFTHLHEQRKELLENIEALNLHLESGLNLFYSRQGHKMNQIMKTLTVTATIFIPLTFVAGVYGMNFRHMPELGWEWGYFTVWGIVIAMVVGMMFWFRKKRKRDGFKTFCTLVLSFNLKHSKIYLVVV